MIPLAAELRDMGHNIFIGAGEKHLSFLKNEVHGLTYINFPGFSPEYSRFLPQYLILLFKIPLLIYHLIREHYTLKSIIGKFSIDIVISDNRFGLWNKTVRTVYVTHMPLIPLPKTFAFLEFIGVFLHRTIIRKYTFCFIPDLPGGLNISGRLSHTANLSGNTRFIGILSRFSALSTTGFQNPANFRHNTIIISGPAPQNGIFEKRISEVLKGIETPTVVLGGKPGKPEDMVRSAGIIYYNHLPAPAMKQVITGSEHIIARAGYTTIMELISLHCSALLIPTPGQTEQEYLAENLAAKGWFTSIPQKDINENLPLSPAVPKWGEEIITQSRILLERAIKEMLEENKGKC